MQLIKKNLLRNRCAPLNLFALENLHAYKNFEHLAKPLRAYIPKIMCNDPKTLEHLSSPSRAYIPTLLK